MREGDEIPIFYDALLAKLIVWGSDREDARRGLEAALTATEIAGVANNRDFLLRLVRHRDFAAGAIDTGFIERHQGALTVPLSAAPLAAVAAASLALLQAEPQARSAPGPRLPGIRTRLGACMTAGASPGRAEYELHWSDGGLRSAPRDTFRTLRASS